jgi:DNA repair exonuclease SbcCD ATPase subunit
MSSNTIAKNGVGRAVLVELLNKIQDRLNRVARETRQNTEAIATLRDGRIAEFWKSVNVRIGKLEELIQRHDTLTTFVGGLRDDVVRDREINNKREAEQTLRDQNNVQSLINLRVSTQKGFDDVRKDVESLMKTIQRLNERVGQVESQGVVDMALFRQQLRDFESRLNSKEPATITLLPADHVWVNKKLSGVYDTTNDLEKRIQQLELLAKSPMFYMGLRVRNSGNVLIVDDKEFFPFTDEIVNLKAEPYGLIVTIKNGDQFILCGGPSIQTMFVYLYKKA